MLVCVAVRMVCAHVCGCTFGQVNLRFPSVLER